MAKKRKPTPEAVAAAFDIVLPAPAAIPPMPEPVPVPAPDEFDSLFTQYEQSQKAAIKRYTDARDELRRQLDRVEMYLARLGVVEPEPQPTTHVQPAPAPAPAAKSKPGRKPSAASVELPADQVSAMAAKIVALLRATPGMGKSALEAAGAIWESPLSSFVALHAGAKIRTEGQGRGTTYFLA